MYKSNGDLVTGEPVSILLYLECLARSKIFFVRLALGFLIVVDSSIAIKVLWQFKNLLAKATRFFSRKRLYIHY